MIAPPPTVIPLGKLGAPVPALLVILSALILPPPPARTVPVPPVERPKISGIKSSPSETIRSASSSTTISVYCVYAPVEEPGTSTVIVDPTLNISLV